MEKIWNGCNKVVSFLEYILLFIAAVSLIIIVGSVSYGIISREAFNSPVLWTNDLACYAMVYLAFFAAPWVLKHNAHVSVDIFTINLKGKAKKFNAIVSSLIAVTSCIIFFWFSWRTTISLYESGIVMMENIPWPKWVLLFPLAVGSFFLILRFLLTIWKNFWMEDGDDEQSEAQSTPEMV